MAFKRILNIKTKSGGQTAILVPIILFLVSLFYLLIFMGSLFRYQENSSLFIYTSEYLKKFIDKPGGLIEYTGNFLMQGYYSTLYGSFIIALIILICYFLFLNAGKRLTDKIYLVRMMALLPALMILVAQTDYEHFMHFNLGFLSVACYFWIYVSCESRYTRLLSIMLFPVFYYFTGSFAFIFAGLFIIYSLFFEKGISRIMIPALLILIFAVTFFIFRNFIFYQPVRTLTAYPITLFKMAGLKPIILTLIFCIILYPALLKAAISLSDFSSVVPRFEPAVYMVLFLLFFIILYKSYKPDLAKIIRLETMAANSDWDGIINQQEKFPVSNLIAEYYYNLALSEKGILCDRMFHGPQDFGPASLCLPRSSEYYNRSVYFYYTIGMINEARHLAYESMVAYGYRPGNLKMLIKTELINGNFRVAEKYINDLRQTFHYRKAAEKFEKLLKNPELIRSDHELGRKLLLLPGTDFFIRPEDRDNINLLFHSNPSNLIVFEYRIAWMLLEKDFKVAVNEIRNLKLLGYNKIPRHLEEAAVGYSNITKILPDLGGLSLRTEVEKDFYEYGSAHNLYSKSKESLAEQMEKAWGKTYWYYLQFR